MEGTSFFPASQFASLSASVTGVSPSKGTVLQGLGPGSMRGARRAGQTPGDAAAAARPPGPPAPPATHPHGREAEDVEVSADCTVGLVGAVQGSEVQRRPPV